MVVIASVLEAVTVYARGARVTRTALAPAPLPARVRLAALPISLIDGTVRVEVVGPAVATSVHVSIDAPATRPDAAASEEPDDLRAMRRHRSLVEAERERLEAALEQLTSAPLVAADPSDGPPAAWDAVVSARIALTSVRAARELALRERLAAVRADAESATLALELLATRESRASSARGAKHHELYKAIDIELAFAAGRGDVQLRVEYQVRAARWAPSYVARLDEAGARVELRAVVAQRTGEDWLGVALVLSTAEPAQLAELPELAPQRIGRRQEPPARRGFRAAPSGADALYADYDRTRTRPLAAPAPAPVPMPMQQPMAHRTPLADQRWDDGSSHAKARFVTPPTGVSMPQMMQYSPSPASAAAPVRPMASRGHAAAPKGAVIGSYGGGSDDEPDTLEMKLSLSGAVGGAPGAASTTPTTPTTPAAPAPVPRLDYANLRMPPATAADRGRLGPAPGHLLVAAGEIAARLETHEITALALPAGCADAWAHTYDYAFAADGRIDVASDAAWHSLAITAQPATVTLRHVAVPREQPDVFRVAQIANPFAGPLLAGPIDVYDRGRFLVTSELEATPPGGQVEIGLGVDAQVKIARNSEFREEAAGMLRGALRLVHAIAIDVENLSPRAIDLEVRERMPVAREGDDAIEVAPTRVEPAWERWTPDPGAPAEARLRGGYRWRVAVPASGGKVTLRAGYEVKIASKLELVGGNRRES